MKQITKIALIVAVLFSCAVTADAQNRREREELEKVLSAFPQAQAGMVRHVIYVKKMADESLLKVELIPGKIMSVDCNHHTLMGDLAVKDLSGWGYTYYEFTTNGQTRSTMMACNAPNENRFVTAESTLVRYNSRMPIVVYAPVGYEIKYKVWKAGKLQSAQAK